MPNTNADFANVDCIHIEIYTHIFFKFFFSFLFILALYYSVQRMSKLLFMICLSEHTKCALKTESSTQQIKLDFQTCFAHIYTARIENNSTNTHHLSESGHMYVMYVASYLYIYNTRHHIYIILLYYILL